MAFNSQMIEEIGAWCLSSVELVAQQREARRLFFGEDDPRPVKYWPGAGEVNSRERRFLGYFMFDYALPSGEKPAAVAVKRLYSGELQAEALRAVSQTRFVLAVVKSKIQRSVYLELEEESFEVRSPIWAANVAVRQAMLAHLVPVRQGYWLPGPGWLVWPFSMGPGLRERLKRFQLDPISTERFLQSRIDSPEQEARPSPPRDSTLEKAVARLTEWAREKGHAGLVMPADEWAALVLKHMTKESTDAGGFFQVALGRLEKPPSEKELQEMLGLLMNIWNNTPQPDRGGRSANQLLPGH